MPAPAIYLNVEDDVKSITLRLRATPEPEVVLVVPKQAFLFSDPINVKLLKKQVDILGKNLLIVSLDEQGKTYARAAGFRVATPVAKKRVQENVSESAPKQVEQVSPKNVTNPRVLVTTHNLEAKSVHKADATLVTESISPEKLHEKKQPQPSGARRLKIFAVSFLLIALVLVVALVELVLPKATIAIYPKQDSLERDIEMSLSTHIDTPDPSRLVAPAKLVEKTKTVSSTFASSGKKEVGSKARGKVVIYNLTGQPINLKKGTTVLSVGNKNYYFDEDQALVKNIPPNQANSPNAPLPVPVTIEAATGGEDANVPAGVRLEITNQIFGSRPQVLYAKSVTPIEGGSSRFISQVTDTDLANAQSQLISQAVAEVRSDLQNDNQVLLDKAYTATVQEFTPDRVTGTESPNFEATLKVNITGLAIDQEMLLSLIRTRIISGLPNTKQLQSTQRDILNPQVKSLDVANGILAITVHYQTLVEGVIETSVPTQELVGKTKEAASAILLKNPEIARVDIVLAPSWQTRLPRLARQITIQVVKSEKDS